MKTEVADAPRAIDFDRYRADDPFPYTARQLADGDSVPTSGGYIALWLALTSVTTLVVLAPNVPSATFAPRLSAALGSVSVVAALALLQLGLFRFSVLRRPIDMYAGIAFGALAVSDCYAAWAPAFSGVDVDSRSLQRSAYFLLLMRSAAATLFLCGLYSGTVARRISRRSRWCAEFAIGATFILVVLGIEVLLAQFDFLPDLLDATTVELVKSHMPVDSLVPGQRAELVLANSALALLLLGCSIGYTQVGRRLRDRHLCALAAGLMFLSFGQLNMVLMPAMASDYVSTADLFAVSGYAVLALTVIWQTAQEWAANASQSERLRVSRELHDGLAQQLAVLQLRLGRLREATDSSDPRSHDLVVAQHLLESASTEAREAIVALRSSRVTWHDFGRTLQALADEFALRHEIRAQIHTDSSDALIDGELQADAVRMLQEAFSNAARHGHADQIEAAVTHERSGLHISVRDNGCGFDPRRLQLGVGLRSMEERVKRRGGTLLVQSVPGQGATIDAYLQTLSTNRGSRGR